MAALGLLSASLLGLPRDAPAQGLPIAKPEQVGLSSEGLAKIGDWMRAEVAAKKIPGATLMIVRGGKLAYAETVGVRDPASGAAMKADDIFRIYSMTKPIVSVAAMMLVEEGKLDLDAPVAKYIPAFANVKVGVEKPDSAGAKTLEIVDAVRPMTVRDLMRHTSGLTYGFFGTGLVKQAYRDARIGAEGDISTAQFADALAKLPLAYQPGSTWDYSNSTDVLGRVVEVVSGQSLGAFLKARLFDPLGMKDTSFYVTDAERQARLAEPFPGDGISANSPLFNPRKPVSMESGGGGLMSTAVDYTRFLLMLRNGGQLDGKRYISETTLKDMTRDHLGPQVVRTALYLPGRRLRLRPGLRRAHRRRHRQARQRRRRVLLGRCRGHLHVGRPGERPVRRLHDAKPEAARAAPRGAARAGVRRRHRSETAGRAIAAARRAARAPRPGVCG